VGAAEYDAMPWWERMLYLDGLNEELAPEADEEVGE
jgi:hypothetical protein